jgi:hypothetical protein
MPGKIVTINIGAKKGIEKDSVEEIAVIENWEDLVIRRSGGYNIACRQRRI